MSTAADRRHPVAETQAMSKALRAIISSWNPDGGWARSGRPKPETDPVEWVVAGQTLCDIAERAEALARFSCDSARAAREAMTEEA